jgi:membrane protein DedA with SNARE-associated domain
VFDSITDWVTTVINTLGYGGVAFLVALESVFPPIPSEVVLPLAGFVAGRGDASMIGMIIAATIGSVIGAWILYGISAWIGQVRLRRMVLKYGGWLGVKDRDITRAEEWFDRRSNVAVAVGRCVPLIRSLVSIPAGFRRMPLVRFTLLTAAGSFVWNAALIGAGAALGENWEQVGKVIERFQLVVIVVIVAAVGWFLFHRLVKPRILRSADSEP